MYQYFDKLSYSMQKKTKKIIDINENLKSDRKTLLMPGGVFSITSAYFLFNFQRYTSYVFPAFSESVPTHAVRTFDLFSLFSCVITGIIFFWKLRTLKSTRESYDKLRKDIIEAINSDFCNCRMDCDCRDSYIKYMEGCGIDLVF